MNARNVHGRPDYGIDAPGVIATLFCIGAGLLLLRAFAPQLLLWKFGSVTLDWRPAVWIPGIPLIVEAGLMMLYSKRGKLWHRDRMLALYPWRGDERVLDVGTGRGLMLIGAAKKLTTGRATGIDVWRSQDLTGNLPEATARNIQIEGVADLCDVFSMGAQKMDFPDATFEVVVSNLCLHNIETACERDAACREIIRVLKAGGVAIVSDYIKTKRYAKIFRECGAEVTLYSSNWLTTFPPLRIVVAIKR